MACASRHHTWRENPPVRGATPCTKCGTIFGIISPKVRPTNGATTVLGADRFARMSAALASLSPVPVVSKPVTGTSEQSERATEILEPDEIEPRARPNGWQKGAARRMRRLFFAAMDRGLEALNRIPGETDSDDEKDVEESLADSLAAWFPDSAMTPTKSLALALGFAGANAWASSKKAPPTKPLAIAPTPPPADAPQTATRAPSPAEIAKAGQGLSAFDG